MIVDRFTTLDELEALRSRWAELYRLDPQGNVFLAWDWLYACLASERRPWIVLAARQSDRPYAAFLPLSFGRRLPFSHAFDGELHLGPGPRADFTGMLGMPGQESFFIPALARGIEQLSWDSFNLGNCNDKRVGGLISELKDDGYRLVGADPTPCPYVDLPSSWESYLNTRGRSTRATIRKHLRRIENLPDYRLHFAPPSEAEEAIENLLQLHSRRWKQDIEKWRKLFHDFFARCYASGRFAICTMSQGATLFAAQGFFIEPTRRRIVAYMIAHHPAYSKYSPGTMLTCASIRQAIENGFEKYSLSLGAQPYKMSLATGVSNITNATLWRRNARASARYKSGQAVVAVKSLARKILTP